MSIVILSQLLRVKQWIKNSFVVAPLLFTKQFLVVESVLNTLLGVVVFCLASSLIYILNDIRDVEEDRKHPKKMKSKPLASGRITVRTAYFVLAMVFFFMVAMVSLLPVVFFPVVSYICLNLLYIYKLKTVPVVDIFSISLGFVFRVWCGAAVLSVPLSLWMLVTTLCLALFLASIKRRQELLLVQGEVETRKVLNSYSLSLVDKFALISSIGAMIFYSLFVLTVNSKLIYSVPVVIFGLFRYWYIVEQFNMGESPTETLLKDKTLIVSIVVWCLVSAFALLWS